MKIKTTITAPSNFPLKAGETLRIMEYGGYRPKLWRTIHVGPSKYARPYPNQIWEAEVEIPAPAFPKTSHAFYEGVENAA